MKFKSVILLWVCFGVGFQVSGQTSWTLERCIEYALQNSLTVKQAANQIQSAELNLQQANWQKLPSVNGTGSGGYQFGRTIDPVSNDFVTQGVGFNSFSLNAGVMVYGGGRVKNTIRQSQVDASLAKVNADAVANQVALDVAAAYLSVLLAEEQVRVVDNTLSQSQRSLELTNKLINAGAQPEASRFENEAQVARNEQALVDVQNLVATNKLRLQQLMQLDPTPDFRIQYADAVSMPSVNPNTFSINEVYANALSSQPSIAAADLQVESATVGLQIARAGHYPTVNVFGNLSTNYSTAAKEITGFSNTRIRQTVFLNNDPVNFEIEQSIPQLGDVGYFTQLSSNFGQGLGISINVPIFNQFNARVNTQRAQLLKENATLDGDRARQTLKAEIQRAVLDAQSAYRSLESARRSETAAQIAYDNTNKRFQLGAANSFELNNATDLLAQAKTELIRARYQYLFNVKVVEFYQGKKLTLN